MNKSFISSLDHESCISNSDGHIFLLLQAARVGVFTNNLTSYDPLVLPIGDVFYMYSFGLTFSHCPSHRPPPPPRHPTLRVGRRRDCPDTCANENEGRMKHLKVEDMRRSITDKTSVKQWICAGGRMSVQDSNTKHEAVTFNPNAP